MKIILASLLLLLVACSSHKKAAIKLTEEGLHEAALEQWVLAYQKDKDDPEVLAGLRICQEKVSNDRLVRIRDLRNANDDEKALEELQSLMGLQSKHGIQLDFNSSTFQGRETALLWKHQKSQVLNLVAVKKPLAAEVRYRKFANVFQSLPDYAALKTSVDQAGVLQCKSLRKGLKGKPFYRSFVSQYCKFFEPNRELKPSADTISSVLFANPVVTAKIEGSDEDMSSKMVKALSEGFEASAWYHPEAKKTVSLNVGGRYKWNKRSEIIAQSHDYTVEVPYTAYEQVAKTKEVPYSDSEYQCEPNRTDCRYVTVTKYKTETYYESEPVTRYREETRVHHYKATKRNMDFEIVLSGNVAIDKLKHPFAFMKEETENKILHDENLPGIGLKPKTEDVTSPIAKFEYYSLLSGGDLRLELDALWIKQFCATPSDENVIKCRRAPSYPEAFVDTWFLNNFGVSSKDTEALIGKF
jgi:hypothetical protein